jgi:hypothetical protein
MTVIFKDYKATTSDERAFYYLYLDGVREGIIELNGVLEEKRQQPLFCLHEKLALTIEQVEDINDAFSRKDNRSRSASYWTYSRARFCKKRFPVTKSISRQCAMAGGNKQTNQMFVPIGSCQITSQVWFFGNAN